MRSFFFSFASVFTCASLAICLVCFCFLFFEKIYLQPREHYNVAHYFDATSSSLLLKTFSLLVVTAFYLQVTIKAKTTTTCSESSFTATSACCLLLGVVTVAFCCCCCCITRKTHQNFCEFLYKLMGQRL